MLLSVASGDPLDARTVARELRDALDKVNVRGVRVLVIVPDDTRTLPSGALSPALCESLAGRAESLTILVALGTHPGMDDSALARHFGWTSSPPGVSVLQHDWLDESQLARVGLLSREEVRSISQGTLDDEVPVAVNKAVLSCGLYILLGPVFPHELHWFSGGHKYLFPGVSGEAMLHQTHWLGALITNPEVNGRRDTPPRRMIEAASRLVPGKGSAYLLS